MEELYLNYKELLVCRDSINNAISLICNCFKSKGKLLLCGNGGSACDAEHIAGELMKGFLNRRPLNTEQTECLKRAGDDGYISSQLQIGLPCIVLSSLLGASTAFANDVNPLLSYAQQAFCYTNSNDIFWGISTSGNAKNVYYAALCAKAKGAKIIALTGENGGKLSSVSDICIKAPSNETFRVQELHLPIYHAICATVEKELFVK